MELSNIVKSVCLFVRVSLFGGGVWAESYAISDQLAVCAERHGNLSLCVRPVFVNGTVQKKKMS